MARIPAIVAVPLVILTGCAEPPRTGDFSGGKADDFGSFEEFLDFIYCEPDSDICIVQGDVPLNGLEEQRAFYERLIGGQALTVFSVDSVDSLWDTQKRFDLTYCISSEFGERKAEVATAMREATEEWEALAHLDFRRLEDEEDNCTERNPRVVFDVAPSPEFAFYLARAFFPHYEDREDRRVLINVAGIDDFLDDPEIGEVASLRGILRHELGHVIGFRHEHTRPESGAIFCFEDNDFRPITDYDAKSVMHYPQCNGEGNWSLSMTENDAAGAAFFYPNFDDYVAARCEVELLTDDTVNPDCAPVVHEIIELANKGSLEVLDKWVGLDIRAANEIVDGRLTSPYNDLQDVYDVTFLGEVSVRRMYEYLYVDGRCPTEMDEMGRVDARCRPVVHKILELANTATFEVLDVDVNLDRRAAGNITAIRRYTPFVSLADLWAVSFVKTRALGKMYDFLYPAPPSP